MTSFRWKEEALILRQSTVAFGVLLAAFVISALILTGRRWAWSVVLALVLALLSVGVFWYYPVVAAARIEAGAMGVVGWLEGSLYMGLLFVAGCVCVLNLLGARLVPDKG
jgi:hypothetical protein